MLSRKEFLRDTVFVAAGLAFLPRSLFGETTSEEKGFDFIIVGGGASGVIAAQRLVEAGKKVLLIEAGGPTSKRVGGNDYPSYITDQSQTIFDIPGEYGNIAWQAKGDKYKLKETPFTYQGMGYGGNSQFNGMLFQMAPAYDFDKNWPVGWKSGDIRAYGERIQSKMHISGTPSVDGKHYLNLAADAVHAVYAANGFAAKDTSFLGGLGERYFSYPTVVSKDGTRGGPVEAYLTSIVGENGESKVPNFTIFRQCKVEKILFDDNQRNKAVGVSLTRRKNLQDSNASGEKTTEVALLKNGGRVIMAAGALITPRLLMLSGIGPQSRRNEILGANSPVQFHVNNENIGVRLFDHVGAMVSVEFTGNNTFQSYDYARYQDHADDIQKFITSKTGPYTQFGPVSVAHEVSGPEAEGQPNIEYFVNHIGVGGYGTSYNTKKDFSVYAMHMRPRARELLRLDANGFVQYPSVYLTNNDDLTEIAKSIQHLVRMLKTNPNFKIKMGPGGVSHPGLNVENLNDVKAYVSSWNPFKTPEGSDVHYTRLIMNHWGGTCPVGSAVNAATLVVEGTANIHVIDASLIPAPLSAHPVATIMAVAEKASDILVALSGGKTNKNFLNPGEVLSAGQSITSLDGKTILKFQVDGNFVVYYQGRATWSTGTSNRSATKATLQVDGNLVVYTADNRAVWASGTYGNAGTRLVLNDDSSLVILKGAQTLWTAPSKH